MKKDWSTWSVHINRHHFHNWSIGIDYYEEYEFLPSKAVNLLAKIFQVNLLFFNITITKWGYCGWI